MIRREAREWLPSRFRLASFKLVGYMAASILPRKNSEEEPVAVLSFRAGQHPFEAFFLATAVLILSSSFAADAVITSFDPPLWATPLIIASSPLIAWIAWLILMTALWPTIELARRLHLVKSSGNVELQTMLQQIVLLAIAIVVVIQRSWSVAAAFLWLIFALTNLLSAIVVFALRTRIASLEKELGENPCAV